MIGVRLGNEHGHLLEHLALDFSKQGIEIIVMGIEGGSVHICKVADFGYRNLPLGIFCE